MKESSDDKTRPPIDDSEPPPTNFSDLMATVSGGDFDAEVTKDLRDAIAAGELRKCDSAALARALQATIQGMGDAARQVERASHEVRSSMQRVQESARIQSEATSSAAAAVEEVTVSIGEVAAPAEPAANAAATAPSRPPSAHPAPLNPSR